MNKEAAKVVTAIAKAVGKGKARAEKGEKDIKIDTVRLANELAARKNDQKEGS
jgi:hypothetical protein